MVNSIITGSGAFLPDKEVNNKDFIENPFCFDDGRRIQNDNQDVINKFEEITGIRTRRYVNDDQSCSDIAAIAAKRAVEDSNIDPEDLDMIIVAHNFGDVIKGSNQTDIVPSIASRVKHNLGIANPNCVPYDIIFGCPGWVQGVIQSHIFIQAGEAKKCLIIGAEVLSRVVDPFDRDTMIFADGAGAVVLEAREEEKKRGVLGHATVSHALEERYYLSFGKSYNKFGNDETKFIKMNGHKIYQYALTEVPKAMKACLDKIEMPLTDIKKVLLHQANEKMDQAILKRLYRAYGIKEIPENVMPMIIERLGNSSVATVPTLYDLILKGELENHSFQEGDNLLFASVGAGMNINALVYRV